MTHRIIHLAVLFMAVFGQTSSAQLGGPGTVSVSEATLPAKGRNHVVFELDRPWRVSAQVTSPMGTALRVVDRIEGPGPWSGEPGEADGRVDLLLDKGSYKVDLRSPEAGTDSATLEIHPFTEISAETIDELDSGRLLSSTLGDLEQRSYWFSLDDAKTVRIDAAGRALTDLQIWRDGVWLVEIQSIQSIAEPVPGKPMTRFLLAGRLEAGDYLVTAYGGDPLPWAFEPELFPLHLRFGIRERPEFFAATDSISPFGTDYYLVPRTTNTLMLFLDEKKDFEVQVGLFDSLTPHDSFREWGTINKESVEPECLIRYRRDRRDPPSLVAVSGSPGERYQLLGLHAGNTNTYRFGPIGTYWFSTILAGRLADAIDATGIVVQDGERVQKAMVPQLGEGHGWRQRFNLLEESTLFVQTLSGGTFVVNTSGVPAKVKIEPFLTRKPDRYRSPEAKQTPCTWELEKGYHVVTFQPIRQGIVEAVIRSSQDQEDDLIVPPRRVCCNSGIYTLRPGGPGYTLHTNRQPGIISGLSKRRIPIDLREPFFFELYPGEEISFPIRNKWDGILHCSTKKSVDLDLFLDKEEVEPGIIIDTKKHSLKVRNAADTYAIVTLSIGSREELFEGPPWSPPMVLKDQPVFPALLEHESLFFDFEWQQSHSALLRVPTPSSYTVESLGLLKTTCRLRTRTKTGLLSACCNGPGRNCLLSAFLGEGLYRVTVEAQELSRGRAGLILARGAAVEGDTLHPGMMEALHVPAGHSLVNWLQVDSIGLYEVSTRGESRQFLCRIDDSEGWPLLATGSTSSVQLVLEPGLHSITTYPSDVEGSRITTFDHVTPYIPLKGKGPHKLALGKREENMWVEGADGEPRQPDVYLFVMPAPSEATVRLSSTMRGRLIATDTDKLVADVRQSWQGHLGMGIYRLEVENRVVSNLQEYWVEISCADLVAGTAKDVHVPAELRISIGKAGMVAIRTEGQHDVKAELLRPDGTLLQQSDDCLADWNFTLCARLEPGAYRLRITPVGRQRARSTVSMSALEETWAAPVALPAMLDLVLAEEVRVLPFNLRAEHALLAIHIKGTGLTGYSLTEGAKGENVLAEGRTLETTLLVTPPSSGAFVLRLWPWSRTSASTKVELIDPEVKTVSLKQLEKGVEVDPVQISEAWIAALCVEPDKASTYTSWATRRRNMALPLSYAIHPGERLRPQESQETAVSFMRNDFFLAAEAGGDRRVKFKGSPLILKPAEEWTCFVRGTEAIHFDVEYKKDRMSVVIATARDGQPGMAFGGRNTTVDPPLILDQGIAVAALPPGQKMPVWLWNALGDGTSGPLEVGITHRTAKGKKLSLFPDHGLAGGAISESQGWRLPTGDKLIRVGCSEELLVLLWNGDRILDCRLINLPELFAGFTTSADHLTLMPLAAGSELEFSVELLKSEGLPTSVYSGDGLLFEQATRQRGVVCVSLSDILPSSHVVALAEEPRACRWVDGNGIIHAGWDHLVSEPGGYIEINHGPGLVKAWATVASDSLGSRWGPRLQAKPIPLYEPAMQNVFPGGSKWVVWGEKAMAINVVTEEAMCFALEHQGRIVALEEGTDGVVMSKWCPSGEYHIVARGLAGKDARGDVTITTARAEPVEEPFGPWAILKPGESRYYSFGVSESGKIGLGVQGARDVTRCELLTVEGEVLGEGVRMVSDLEKGQYILRIYLPAKEDAVKARAVVAGLIPPGSGPPEDYIRQLLSRAGFVQEGE